MPLSSIFPPCSPPLTVILKSQHVVVDPIYPLVTCTERVALTLGTPHGTWITLQNPVTRIMRAAKIRVQQTNGESDSHTNTLYTSSWFLNTFSPHTAPPQSLTVHLIRIGGTWTHLSQHGRHRRIAQDSPPTPFSFTVARVKAPDTTAHEDYSNMIARFFSFSSSKRVLRVGDVFVVRENAEVLETEQGVVDGTLCSHAGIIQTRVGVLRMVAFQVTQVRMGKDDTFDYMDEVEVHPDSTRVALLGAVNCLVFDCEGDDDNTLQQRTPLQLDIASALQPAAHTHATLLLCGSQGSGKKTSVRAVARTMGFHFKHADMTTVRGLPQDRIVAHLEEVFAEAQDSSPCVLLLSEFASLGGSDNSNKATSGNSGNGAEKPEDPDLIAAALRRFCFDRTPPPTPPPQQQPTVLVVATADTMEDVHAVLHSCFTHKIVMPTLDTLQKRMDVLKQIVGERCNAMDESLLHKIAVACAGRTALELRALVAEAGVKAMKHGGTYEWSDFETALESLPTSVSIDAPKIPAVYWDDVGGLNMAKQEIIDMIETPLRRPDLFQKGMRARSGILLYGPPGTGKTLLAKAVATEFKLNFISVKGPELLDMYIGESERKVRQIFETARAAKPCILFFDEFDSLAPQRGRGADSGGVMDRVVSQLLTEIDGMSSNSDAAVGVFVIAATNRPDLLDQSLLRPGRFDRFIYLGISKDREDQKKIIQALTRKFTHAPTVDLEHILQGLPSSNLTGADFYALCSGAMANALNRRVTEIQTQAKLAGLTPQAWISANHDSVNMVQVIVDMQDYELAKRDLVPSVSEGEVMHYESLRAKFSSSSTSPSQ